jgi:integrase
MREAKLGKYRGKFCVIYYDERGQRFRHSLGTTDHGLAKTRLGAFLSHLKSQARDKPVTIAEIYAAYLDDRASEDKSTTRIRDAWKRLQGSFGHLRPADVSKADVKRYTDARRKAGVSPGTIHTELTYLRAALAYAVKEQWLQQAPYIPVPQKPGPREHHLTREDAQKLLAAASMPHVKLFIRLAFSTAGRASALLELTWDRVDLDARRIDLRDPDRPRTRKGRARVPINDSLLAALVEAREGATSPYVIEWGGDRVLSVKKGVGAAARRAGVKCSPHVLRHTAAVWMAEDGVPMEQVAQYLGHDDSRTTERVYARFSPDFLRAAARSLDL